MRETHDELRHRHATWGDESQCAGTNGARDFTVRTCDPMDEESLQAAKLEAMAEFAAGAGHEINNPLAAISGRAQLLLRDETDPQRRRHLITIGAQALRVRDMIGDAMLFARPPQPEPQRVDLNAALDEVRSALACELLDARLSIGGRREPNVDVWADPVHLRIVLSELLRNAIRFAPPDSIIQINIRHSEPDVATIVVHDDGPGLSDIDREHLFDPFYSGRQAGRGLGFGLPKCWRIVTLHDGRIRTVEGDGFAIRIDWPAAQSCQTRNSAAAPEVADSPRIAY